MTRFKRMIIGLTMAGAAMAGVVAVPAGEAQAAVGDNIRVASTSARGVIVARWDGYNMQLFPGQWRNDVISFQAPVDYRVYYHYAGEVRQHSWGCFRWMIGTSPNQCRIWFNGDVVVDAVYHV